MGIFSSEEDIEKEHNQFAHDFTNRTSAVISIRLSVDGLFNFEADDSWKSVGGWEKALDFIKLIAKTDKRVRNATILWTPNSDEEVLSPRKLFFEYPDLEQEYLRHEPILTYGRDDWDDDSWTIIL